MKKRSVTKFLSIVLAASMIATSAAPATALAAEVSVTADDETTGQDLGLVENTTEETVATEPVTEAVDEPTLPETSASLFGTSTAAYEDGANDNWTQDEGTVLGEDAVNELVDGMRHLKAGSQNGNAHNNPASWPAVFVNPNEFDFTAEGFFEFTVNTKANPQHNRFGIFLGYQDPGNGMFIGYDNYSKWYWQQYKDGSGTYTPIGGTNYPQENTSVHVKISWTADKKVSVTVDDQKIIDALDCADFIFTNKIGVKCSTYNGSGGKEITEVWLSDIHYTGQKEVATYTVSGKVKDSKGNAVAGASVKLGNLSAATDNEGAYSFPEVADGNYTIQVTKNGYEPASTNVEVSGAALTVPDITLTEKAPIETEILSTDDMDVYVAKHFPSVVKYEMKGDLQGKTFYGQEEELNTIVVNGVSFSIDKADLTAVVDDTKKTATYVMNLKKDNDTNPVDCIITAVLTAVDNTVSFDITDVKNLLTETELVAQAAGDPAKQEKYPVQRIEIPNHSLISVNSTQTNANLKGAVTSSDTGVSGDSYYDVTDDMTFKSGDYMYAFVSNNELSAGLWSNSEHTGSFAASPVGAAGGAGNTRIMATVTSKGGVNTLGLASTEWYYDRKITTRLNQKTGDQISYVIGHTDMPNAKVAIAGDLNGDKSIDWQDGAIAYRDIMKVPQGSEDVPNLVNQRIAENFASQAAEPFLMTLDGVKKVNLNTDGLGQSIILKGYASEGHDSGHPDYGHVGERMGGVEDMNTLIAEGQKLGALFGVHINASEMYTEAKAFSNDLSAGNYGWNWLDQGIGINSYYDLGSGARWTRLNELKEAVGAGDFKTDPGLNYIYLDVWGNYTTTNPEDSWESRQIAKQINDLGWRFTTEWGSTMEYDSTLQHWAADLTYGDASSKGQNSQVIRFLRNHLKDSWIADYQAYGGEAEAPLLGGLTMTDFEGWSGRTDYDNYITKMFRHNVVTKFLQHYQVVKWENAPESDRYSFTHTVSGGTHSHTWLPSKEITLRNTEDASDNTELVVTRKSTDHSNLADYRSRTITMNGVEISTGSVTSGDDSNPGTETYLIPWNWAADGTELAKEDQKLYHWNTKGGTTTWTLTEDWQNQANVVVYKLTEDGKTDKQTVNVVDKKITLTAEAETPYVVYRGEKTNTEMNWKSTKYITDTGFNDSAALTKYWTKAGTGSAEIVENMDANRMLKLDGEVAVTSEKLTNLEAGKKYAVYVGVDNRSDARTYMSIKSGDTTLAYNYTGKSIVQNIVATDQHHRASYSNVGGTTGDGYSYFQNMYVFFVAPQDTSDITLVLGRVAGKDGDDGSSYLDDIRVVPTNMDVDLEKDDDGIITRLHQDFENNVQGIWPFVISGPGAPIYAVTDNRIHLSEYNGEYTEAGYKDKRVDDVLGGSWSVKINGLSSNNSMIYQTIPQNFHFEPGVTYHVSFDYQTGSDGAYAVKVGEGSEILDTLNMKGTTNLDESTGEYVAKTARYGFTFTAGESGQGWFGIYSTDVAPDMKDAKRKGDGAQNFSGYRDFILDNLVIEKADFELSDTEISVTSAKDTVELKATVVDGVTLDGPIEWTSDDESIAGVDENGVVTFYGYGSTIIQATASVNGVKQSLGCTVTLVKEVQSSGRFVNVWANTEETAGEPNGNGVATTIIDGSGATYWHSKWSGTGFEVSESNPAIVTVALSEGDDIANYDTITFQQRPSGTNGIIQKYECVVGDTFDQAANTITGGTTTGAVTVSAEGAKAGSIVPVVLPEGTAGRYLQIRVLQGTGGFAAMGEITASYSLSYETPEEKVYLEKNRLTKQVKEQTAKAEELQTIIDNPEATEAEKTKAREELSVLTPELETAKTKLEEYTEYANLYKELEEAKADLEKAEGEKAELNKQLQEAQEKLDKLTGEKTALEEELNKVKQELQDAKDQINILKKEAEDAKKDAEDAKKEAEEAEQAKKEAEEALKKKEEEQKALEEALKKKEEEQKLQAEELQKKEAEKKAAEDAAKKAQADAEQLKKQLQDAQDKLDKLNKDNNTIQKGDTVVYKNVTYKVLDADKKTVAVVKAKDVASITIYGTVKVNGVTCSVTEISSNAFKGAKKLKKAVIGANVTKIGKRAFYGAKKLRTVSVKTAKLKSVGRQAFGKIYTRAKITVPKSKKAAYKKLLKNKVPKKAVIK